MPGIEVVKLQKSTFSHFIQGLLMVPLQNRRKKKLLS